MRLYDAILSPYGARVRLAIYRKGLAVEIVPPPPREDYRAINPGAKVPCLIDGDLVLPESEVIIEYLEDRFPASPLRPADPVTRARARLLARIGDLYVYPPLAALFTLMGTPARDDAEVTARVRDFTYGLDLLEAHLGAGGMAAGEQFSTADCALVPILFFVFNFAEQVAPALLAAHPKVAAYWRRVRLDPDAMRVIAELEEGLAAFLARGVRA